MSLVLHTILLLALCYAGFFTVQRQFPFRKWYARVFLGALLFKLVLTLASYYIHTTVYPHSDLTAYWQSAGEIASLTEGSTMSYLDYVVRGECTGDCPVTSFTHQPRALLFARWVSLFFLFTGGSAWLASVWMSVLSFSGAWLLFARISRQWPHLQIPAAVALLFYPSPVFWSSSIQKETIALAIIFTATALLLPLLSGSPGRYGWLRLLASGLLGYLLWMVKYYYAAVYLPVMLLTVLLTRLAHSWAFFRNSVLRQALIMGILLVMGFLGGRNFHIAFSQEHFLPLLTRTHHEVVYRSSEGAANHMPGLKADPISFLVYTPEAAWTGFFRPLPGDGTGLLVWLVALENTVLLLLALLAVYLLIKRKCTRWQLTGISTLLYCIFLAVFLAFAMPNYGSLMRYKAAFLPFLLILILTPLVYRNQQGKK